MFFRVKYFKKPDWLKQKDETESNEEVKSIFEVVESYKVDGTNDEIFKGKFKRGDIVNASEIRQHIMNYIKEKNLQDPQNPKFVLINELLQKIFVKNKSIEKIKFDELFSVIFSKMSPMHQIKRVSLDKKNIDSEAVYLKGKFQPVEFKLESRGGNKKVTNIHNLSAFDLDPNVLQSILRKEIGCSVSINETAAACATASHEYVISIQGNQIKAASELLRSNF